MTNSKFQPFRVASLVAIPALLLLWGSIALAQGTLCFHEVDSPAGGNSDRIALADFNGDGILDVAQTHTFDTRRVSTALGVGDGHVVLDDQYMANLARDIAAGDFNNDGIPDIAVAAEVPPLHAGKVWVLLGNGDGSFHVGANMQIGDNAERIKVTDFNRDGNLDVVIETGTLGVPDVVEVFLGNGDGTLQRGVTVYTLPSYPDALATGDLNNDGNPDIVTFTLNSTSSNSILAILFGRGDGTFQNPVVYTLSSSNTERIAIADFNKDGLPDVAVSTGVGVDVLFGTGGGNLASPVVYGENVDGVIAVDVLNSGNTDLVGFRIGGTRPGHIAVFLNNGDGTFAPSVKFEANHTTYELYTGDFNGDGKADLIGAYSDNDMNGVFLNCSTSASK